ncbi:hypothetical protein [Nocardioides hwasunensis]|uniref:Uncharacterized protein n=1 Tax=Nocardioides hwasunensis TaxID=397258 RepID=A0ABR8MPM3_9ACTN|nr:hypothetical protein [Nocardioides hwasunensis]MBD3916770.1 hypothetical protein [Nocardioides hwasunensis]
MSEQPDLEFTRDAAAGRAVREDPFWSTVLRRHGDVDLVVLPPEVTAEVEVPADEPTVDPAEARARLRGEMAAFWAGLGLPGEPSRLDDVWFAGAADGTLRWQGTATFDDVDPATTSATLERARALLPDEAGWHVLAPPEGIPRVLAGRPARLGREEVQVLLATPSRVVVRLRSALVHTGPEAAALARGGEV